MVALQVDIIDLFTIPLLLSRPADYALSKDMINAWTSFAKTGHPGMMGSSGVQWDKAIDKANPFTKHMNLDVKNYRMITDYYRETCNVFWKSKMFI